MSTLILLLYVFSLRDKNDELAKTIQEYALGEKHNLSLSTGLTNLSKAITLLGDFQDIEVSRYEKLVRILLEYMQ